MRGLLAALAMVVLSLDARAFERTTWRSPVVTELAGAGTDIRIDNAPSGLYLRRALDPAKRYLLKVKGSGGSITMRLQLDGRPFEYLPAPSGTMERLIERAGRIELLFYSDKAASYRLEAAELEECRDCQTAADLKARIIAEAPEVAAATGLAKAIALMRWAANRASYVQSASLIPKDFESWPAERAVYSLFDRDEGGVFCAGMAVFLTRVLQLFGIDAFTVDYGIAGTAMTHVSVVVPHDGRFYLVDPTFAATFELDGQPLDIAQALDLVASGRTQSIRMVEAGLERRKHLMGVMLGVVRRSAYCEATRRTTSGRIVCSVRNGSYFGVYQRQQMLRWQRAGIALDRLVLIRLMRSGILSVGPSRAPDQSERFLAVAHARGIPLLAPGGEVPLPVGAVGGARHAAAVPTPR